MNLIIKKQQKAELSDSDLVTAILKESDREQMRRLQEELYARYVDIIYKKCNSIVRNSEVAKDLTHDVLIKVFTKLSHFRQESSLYTWIKTITFNHCMTYLEKKKKLRIEDYESHDFEIAVDDIELEHKVLREVQLNHLEICVEQLPEQERLILVMRYQDKTPVKKIATIMKISESAVKMRLKRSRDHLAQLVKQMGNESKE